ncbi:MAG: saccharopine dehydrogenase (NAD+, L-lysine-forming) [Granulosicoccus sp.]|jgi:saccharopine dehydrogenase (NAD+, L-lysine-forming)
MKIGIIKEGKTPPDHRTPVLPEDAKKLMQQYPDLTIVAQSSEIRCISDSAYSDCGIEVVDSLEDCDVIIGVKEVPLDMLLPAKTYMFFSHTLKAQPYNHDLFLNILSKRIRLIDHETLIDKKGKRLVGFGRFAGIVGAYNGLLAFGNRTGKYNLKPAHETTGIAEMAREMEKCQLGESKILITGGGKVALGAQETLKAANIRQVSVDSFLNEKFEEPVFARSDKQDYYEFDGHTSFDQRHFYTNSAKYKSTFDRFLSHTDILIPGHYWDNESADFFALNDLTNSEFRIKVIADITCDISGSIPTTIRPSTIADPIYGVDKETGKENNPYSDDSITVMAVDNLPCEIPMDASIGFSEVLCSQVIPSFVNGDQDGILATGAMTTNDGKLTERFGYLQSYVDGK